MSPRVVHQPAVQLPRRGLSTNPGVTMWCVCGCSMRDEVCCVCDIQTGHSGDGCDVASTLCKDDLGKGDLFVRSWVEYVRCVCVWLGAACVETG